MGEEKQEPDTREDRLSNALRRVVLLRETGPKSAVWHRARVETIWRLHRLLAEERHQEGGPPPEP